LVAENDLARLLAAIDSNPPATAEAVSEAEAALGRPLPTHYRRFLLEADGCEGGLGDGYVALWHVDDLAELNAAYAVDEFAPGLLLVGSDGGDTAYALDLNREHAPVVALPFVPMDYQLVEDMGVTIGDLLAAIEAG
jgi:cell wall assembly regulator SMI1